jgi:hypothetical protein
MMALVRGDLGEAIYTGGVGLIIAIAALMYIARSGPIKSDGSAWEIPSDPTLAIEGVDAESIESDPAHEPLTPARRSRLLAASLLGAVLVVGAYEIWRANFHKENRVTDLRPNPKPSRSQPHGR